MKNKAMNNYSTKVLIFNLKQNYFAIDVGVVSQVSSERTAPMTFYDNINLVPIFKELLANSSNSLSEENTEPAYIIIKNQFSKTSGNQYKLIKCDKVISVVSIDMNKVQEAHSYAKFKDYILGIYPFMDNYLTLLDTNKLLTASISKGSLW